MPKNRKDVAAAEVPPVDWDTIHRLWDNAPPPRDMVAPAQEPPVEPAA